MIMRTFFDKEPDLNGKTLVPFSTSGGSGLANMPEVLQNQFPKAKILTGFTIEGDKAASAKAKINQWLGSIGY